MNLHLPNKIEIIDADQKLIRFMRAEYELYDGIPIAADSTLTLLDILLSIMMNSRLDTAGKVQSIWRNRQSVEEALEMIPTDVSLEDDSIPWDDLRTLFDAFCAIPWAGAAVATKILYKKRPSLIPIYDSVIGMFISGYNSEPLLPRGSSEGTHIVRGVKYFRNLLVSTLDQIDQLRRLPEMESYQVSPMRILEVLLWIENENMGYYMSCPECQCDDVVPIVYGEPSLKMIRDSSKGKCCLGGCKINENSPKWHCPECEAKWGRARSA